MPQQKQVPTQDEVNDYLDGLRESGVTNMVVSSSYVAREFGLDRGTAATLTAEWMRTFGQRKEAGE